MDVRITGRGRDLVLLHSLLSDRGCFDAIMSRLADRRRLIAVSLPGFGTSPLAGPDIGDYAEAIVGLFDELALPSATDVLGNGLGSFVALSLAVRHGAKFERLVLVGAATAFPEAGRATFRTLADTVERDGMAGVVDIAMRRLFPEDFIAANPDVVAERAAAFQRINPSALIAGCRALARMDLGADVARIRNPTLIVVGTKDGATPPPLARELASKMTDATVVEMPGVGHCPQMQDPDRFIKTIAPFLALGSTAPTR